MKTIDGIGAPETVPVGTTAPIRITSNGSSDTLTVTVLSTGQKIVVDIDETGAGVFELPDPIDVGEFLVVSDPTDFDAFATIEVVPASSV